MNPHRTDVQQDDGMVTAVVAIFEEDGRIIARWPQLKLSAHGDTREEAIRNLVQMVVAVFHVSLERNDLEQMLSQAGIAVEPLIPGHLPPKKLNKPPYLVVETDAGSGAAA